MSYLTRALLLIVFAGILTGCATSLSAAPDLKETDATSKWSYPYTAPAEKETRIRKGIETLLNESRGTPVSKFIAEFGPPDQITDMSKGFAGLSINEDGMLAQYRPHLSHRLVWYVKKKDANSANLNDAWFAAYIAKGSDGVLKIMRNNFK